MALTGAEAIARLRSGHDELASAIAPLTDDQIVRLGALGGDGWSVKDLLWHVASWERRALGSVEVWSRGEPFETLIGIRAVHELNERTLVGGRERSLAEVRRGAADTHDALIERIGQLSDADLRSSVTMSTGRTHRLGTILGSTTGGPAGAYMHVAAHLPDVRAYLAAVGAEGGTIGR